MVTMNQAIEQIKQKLIDNAGFLQIEAKRIQLGAIGEDESEVFTVTNSFIRIYTQQKPASDYYKQDTDVRRMASLMVLCGIVGTDSIDSSQRCYELAERVESLLHNMDNNITRELEPIFAVKNKKGLSIFGVPFWFVYQSSAL